jgi:methionyl-tRNA formyltransferase
LIFAASVSVMSPWLRAASGSPVEVAAVATAPRFRKSRRDNVVIVLLP